MSDRKSGNGKDIASQLGELICKLNPYTNQQNIMTGQSTGEMVFSVDSTKPVGSAEAVVGVEMEGPYRQEWTFKGAPQRVGMAARIKYRYPVKNKDGAVLYWIDEHILVGFAGGMGG